MPEENKNNSVGIDDRYKDGKGSYGRSQEDYDKEFNGIVDNNYPDGDPLKEADKIGDSDKASEGIWRNNVKHGSEANLTPADKLGKFVSNFKSNKKKMGILGLGGGGIVGIVFMFIVLGPTSLFAAMTENLSLTNDSSSHVLERRFAKKFNKMVANSASDTELLCQTAKCNRGRLSNKAIKSLNKKGIKTIVDGKPYSPKSSFGTPKNVKITHYQMPDGKTIAAADLKGFLAKNPKYASKVLGVKGAFNLRVKSWAGKYIGAKFFKKWGVNKGAALVKALSKPFKSVTDKMAKAKAAIKARVPSISKNALGSKFKSLESLKNRMTKGSKGGGVAFVAVMAGCAVSKAPAIIGGAAAAFELAQLIKLINDTALSPGSNSMASGMFAEDGIDVQFTPEAAEALGSVFTETDENGKSALDSKFFLSAIGVNTEKTGVSKEFAPGYSVLTNPALAVIDEIGEFASGVCNFVLSPTGMYTGMAISKGISGGTLIFGLLNGAIGWTLSQLGVIDKAVEKIGGWAIEKSLDVLLEKDKLDNIGGEKLGDALGVAAKAYFSSQGMSRNLSTLSMESMIEFAQIKQENENDERARDIASHSPLDISNRHTFMGSIYRNAQLAMIKNGGLTDNLFARLSAFARVPTTFASMATTNVGAASSAGVSDCSYAAEFGLEGDTPAETPAVNAAGLPCVGISSLQANMSPERAEEILSEPGREWLKTDAEYPEDATVEEYLDAVIGVSDDGWDTPLKDVYLSCGDASTGDYLYDMSGCIAKTDFKIGTPKVDESFTDQITYKSDDGESKTLTELDSVKNTTNAGESLSTDAEAFAAINVFLIDAQLEGIINGTDDDEIGDNPGSGSVVSGEWTLPACGSLTSPYGMRTNPVTGEYKLHAGIDIADGSSPAIKAAKGGVVSYVGFVGGYGNLVVIDHEGDGVQTAYAHLAPNSTKVKVGDVVNSGQEIATMGTTGNSTGVHLHFEIRTKINSNPVSSDNVEDPEKILRGAGVNVGQGC